MHDATRVINSAESLIVYKMRSNCFQRQSCNEWATITSITMQATSYAIRNMVKFQSSHSEPLW